MDDSKFLMVDEKDVALYEKICHVLDEYSEMTASLAEGDHASAVRVMTDIVLSYLSDLADMAEHPGFKADLAMSIATVRVELDGIRDFRNC